MGSHANLPTLAVAGKWNQIEPMYFLLKMLVFQPAMLVTRGYICV